MKTCPFCDSDNLHWADEVLPDLHRLPPSVEKGTERRFAMYCLECGARGPVVDIGDDSGQGGNANPIRRAKELWNKRPKLIPIVDQEHGTLFGYLPEKIFGGQVQQNMTRFLLPLFPPLSDSVSEFLSSRDPHADRFDVIECIWIESRTGGYKQRPDAYRGFKVAVKNPDALFRYPDFKTWTEVHGEPHVG
jgi:hypothetical protein